MRKTALAAVFVSLAAWGLSSSADAFCHKVRTTCIGYYPGLYSYAPCGCGYPPYVYTCTYRFPKFCGHRRACWRGYLTCSTPNPYCYGCGGCGYAGCGYGGCGYGCGCGSACLMGCGGCDSCGVGGCGVDGCAVGGCDGCGGGEYSYSPSVSAPGTYQTDERVLYDGPAPGPEPAPAPAPVDDSGTEGTQTSFRMTSQARRDGTPAFAQGLRSYWDGNMNAALRSFDAAAAAEPQNALYHYYRALAFYNMQGADAAGEWLRHAVEIERQSPVKNWGRSMERVQGRARLWVEQARRDAGLGG